MENICIVHMNILLAWGNVGTLKLEHMNARWSHGNVFMET